MVTPSRERVQSAFGLAGNRTARVAAFVTVRVPPLLPSRREQPTVRVWRVGGETGEERRLCRRETNVVGPLGRVEPAPDQYWRDAGSTLGISKSSRARNTVPSRFS
jgi:hypothetical protein